MGGAVSTVSTDPTSPCHKMAWASCISVRWKHMTAVHHCEQKSAGHQEREGGYGSLGMTQGIRAHPQRWRPLQGSKASNLCGQPKQIRQKHATVDGAGEVGFSSSLTSTFLPEPPEGQETCQKILWLLIKAKEKIELETFDVNWILFSLHPDMQKNGGFYRNQFRHIMNAVSLS